MHHLAHLQMLGTVVLDELIGLVVSDVLVQPQVRLIDGRIGRTGIVAEDGRRKQFVMAGHPDHIVVAGDDPQVVQLVPVHRVLFPQATIVRIGIGDHVGGKHVILIHFHHCHNRSPLSVLLRYLASHSRTTGKNSAASAGECLPLLMMDAAIHHVFTTSAGNINLWLRRACQIRVNRTSRVAMGTTAYTEAGG